MKNNFEELEKYFDEHFDETPKEKVLNKREISLEVFTDHMIENEFTIVGYMLHIPTIGNIFRLHDENSNNFVFSTLNPVIEIEDEFNFKTERCSYRINF